MTPHLSHHKNHARAFTLIEVLVALGLLGLAALAMMKVTQEGVVITANVRDRFFAGIVAENRLVETLIAPQTPNAGVDTGRIAVAGQDWTWTQTVSSTSDPAISRIDITVSLPGSDSVLADLQAFRGER